MPMRVIVPVMAAFGLYGAIDGGVIGLIIAKWLPISIELLILFVAIDIVALVGLVVFSVVMAVAWPTAMGLTALGIAVFAMLCLTAFNMGCAYLALANAG